MCYLSWIKTQPCTDCVNKYHLFWYIIHLHAIRWKFSNNGIRAHKNAIEGPTLCASLYNRISRSSPHSRHFIHSTHFMFLSTNKYTSRSSVISQEDMRWYIYAAHDGFRVIVICLCLLIFIYTDRVRTLFTMRHNMICV